jgi:hypothetical protein
MLRDGNLARVAVETGINDGAMTAVTGGELEEGSQVVTAVAAQSAAATAAGSSPFFPTRRPGANRAQGNRAPGAAR